MKDKIEILEERINALEVMIACLSHTIEQIKYCDHMWSKTEETNEVLKRFWPTATICTLCGLRRRSESDYEAVN